ncbi:hypothetical protein [Streptomyces yaizuensis]|uniref:LppX_LprAFG lipoprotein n=1 Tax=Streptomyces yaizuensis TaxID=2989713 RepID=A0ABQ5NTW0_9ACTN|nr:hypothetical protein [Streptomyces sp. YSPA8]GLF93806.1 LppX_LprAFG lipoprotein [Streptomyces sp. YSPA8]
MNRKAVRVLSVSVAVAAALTSVAACGGSDGDAEGKKGGEGTVLKLDPIAALREVQAKTGEARSARIEGSTEMGDLMSLEQTGVLGWSDGLTGSMEITYTGGSMARSMQASGVSGPMQARYFKDGYAVNMGEAAARRLAGKSWISYSYDDLAKLAGPAGSVLKDQLQNSTPQQAVKALLASGDVRKVGQEKIRGVQATHYSGTVDVAELSAANSKLDAAQLEAFRKQLDAAGITAQQVDVWIDKDSLPVKKVESGEMKNGRFDSTVYYSDYGAKVSAERPPASQTVDFRELAGRAGS